MPSKLAWGVTSSGQNSMPHLVLACSQLPIFVLRDFEIDSSLQAIAFCDAERCRQD